MALTDENGMNTTMLVTPASTNVQNPWGGGFGDGGNWWFILLFFMLLMGNGMWGNNGNGYGSQPIILNESSGNPSAAVQRGFDQSSIMEGIGNIQNSVGNLSTQICECRGDMQNTVNQGFAGVQNALCSGFAGVEQGANARQMASMQQAFAAQTAVSQGFNAAQAALSQGFNSTQMALLGGFNQVGSQLADCCCENRLGIADLKYTVATENCADRTQAMQNTRDIIDSQTRGTQAILDKLCALELDGIKAQLAQAQRENIGLQNQLNMANLAASQTAQTAEIRQNNATVANQLMSEMRSCPIPCQPVYGNQPIFNCGQQGGCGCSASF